MSSPFPQPGTETGPTGPDRTTPIYLGVDFGTCSTRASLLWQGECRMVPAPQGRGYSFPSAAFLTREGELVVGHAAELRAKSDATRYRREFKRDLGAGHAYSLGGVSLTPEALVTAMLSRVKAEAEKLLARHTADPFTGMVLTIPATYRKHKREIMERCAREAGLADVRLLPEPIAAAFAFSAEADWRPAEDDLLLVYDLGGGTFDAALLQQKSGRWELLCEPVGLEHCGGVDFDRAIYADMLSQAPELREKLAAEGDLAETWALRLTLADLCRELKHQLSEEEAIEYTLPGTLEEYAITRAGFEAMIQPLLADSLELCRQLVRSAGLEWSQVTGVLLVGGSCRIPGVERAVAEAFQRPTLRVSNPELAVCRGAAGAVALAERHAEEDRARATNELLRCAITQTDDPREQAALAERVGALLRAGADPNVSEEEDGTSALLFAFHNPPVMLALLAGGADPNTTDRKIGWPPLLHETARGHLEVIRALLGAGANIDFTDANGYTALYLSLSEGHDEVVRLLLAAGASPRSVDRERGSTPLHLALAAHRNHLVPLLLEAGAEVNVRDHSGFTPLGQAASQGDAQTVSLLLARGADVNGPQRDRFTALGMAIGFAKDEETTRRLIRAGADVNSRNGEKGLTPLMLAAMIGNVEIVRQLLSAGADRYREAGRGITAQRCAAASDQIRSTVRRELMDLLWIED